MSGKKIRIGDLLVERRIISRQQLELALDAQKQSGRKMLGRVLIEHGYADEKQILEVLSQQLNIPFTDLMHLSS